ncbi:MAG: PLP-dependent aminotransferase family protein [Devosia sp.]|nr:PLP-dependent aminotransferase family protein [Devosia sp.]MBN9333373.1 PLP-dependent aminotransferase family protein [Devosia sp.]
MWTPKLEKSSGPLYLAIADAIAADIASGHLAPGARLPPQRSLAQALGLDFTTVTRAYQEAGRRGLVDGRVGQGTFVRSASPVQRTAAVGFVDMSMNLPPIPEDDRVAQRMWESLGKLHGPEMTRLMLRYQEPGGALRDRQAGARWLQGWLPGVEIERLLVAPGAQGALSAIVATLVHRGDVILTEPLTYPGFISLAAHFGIRLVAMEMDEAGPIPHALERLIATLQPKALYCTPTLHNPTTRSWTLARREEIAALAGKTGLPLIEDDAYGALPLAPLPPLASLATGPVYHVASVSKSLSPALRLAYLVAPDAGAALRLAGALRGTTAMASPLTATLATEWIESGLAFEFLDVLRGEARERQQLVGTLLPRETVEADREGFHAWLKLPDGWSRGEFISRLRNMGVSAVSSDTFAISAPPEAVRLSLGGAVTREELARSLAMISALLSDRPAMTSLIV